MKQHILLRLLGILHKRLGLYFALTVGIAVTVTLRQIYLAWILKDLFDSAASGDFWRLLMTVGVGLTVVTLLGILRPYFKFLTDRIVYQAIGNLKKELYGKIIRLPVDYFNREHSGNILSRLTNDLNDVETAFNLRLIHLLSYSICAIMATAAMFLIDFWLALIALITAALALIGNAYYSRPLREASRTVQNRIGGLTVMLMDLLAGVKVIQAFNQYRVVLHKFASQNHEVYQTSLQRVRLSASLAAMNDFGKMVDIIGVMGIGAFLSIQGKVSVGAIVAIWQLKTPILMIFKELGELITGLQAGLAGAERIFAVLDEPEEPSSYQYLEGGSVRSADQAIQLHNIYFSYRPGEQVLRGFTLEVQKGQKVAIVGPSGGGKSSICKLLLGFYPPETGEILIDGESVSLASLKSLRQKIAYVPQNAYLFSGTVRENIRYGRVDATDEEVYQAAKLANAHDFIIAFESGYDNSVGERGTQLSGGQRQRIGIARAILKGAPILLFDEATSALDAESEYLVKEALKCLVEGQTLVMITHRLSAIQNADRIYVVADGQIKEQGTHTELMAIPGGMYRALYAQQYDTLKEVI